MSFKDDAKQWFQTGDYPTQQQIYTKFDNLRWKDEPLSIEDITGLAGILNGLLYPLQIFIKDTAANIPFEFTIPADFQLEQIIIAPSVDCICSLKDQGEFINENDEITAAKGKAWRVDDYAINDKTLTITDVPINSKLIFVKRKLTL